jgi:hypothetical protein
MMLKTWWRLPFFLILLCRRRGVVAYSVYISALKKQLAILHRHGRALNAGLEPGR